MSANSPITSLVGRTRRTISQLGPQGAIDNAKEAADQNLVPIVIDEILAARDRHPAAQTRS